MTLLNAWISGSQRSQSSTLRELSFLINSFLLFFRLDLWFYDVFVTVAYSLARHKTPGKGHEPPKISSESF